MTEEYELDENELRAKALAERFGYKFDPAFRLEIQELLKQELLHYQEGSSEYLRFLCGYLFCIGSPEDAELLQKVKFGINMDVGCMIDAEWIDSLQNGGIETENTRSRETLIKDFIGYYTAYFS